MRQIFLGLLSLLFITGGYAQVPEKLSYQSIIRDTQGRLLRNTQIGMRISIIQSSANGQSIYTEIHTPTTNTNGLVNVEIGTGSGPHDFSAINWTSAPSPGKNA
ncbi:hypothetical protein FUAX_54750 (plasmid) [Fulvitalea axinellae]|uniref:Uncharacterized protein n=1 Tax=Fulvitalea axinellae TaxID=1182444 RepID=A0AAU9DAT5_9BACT|nr:hypothetical protein FUAX_54750 [Fulvitalea axinellae]